MSEKSFIVYNKDTNQRLTIKGKNVLSALESEGLDPELWAIVDDKAPPAEATFGNID